MSKAWLHRPTPAEIIAAVCEHEGVDRDDMIHRRTAGACRARALVCAMCHRWSGMSYPEIAAAMQRGYGGTQAAGHRGAMLLAETPGLEDELCVMTVKLQEAKR